jgi:hypothetical protein
MEINKIRPVQITPNLAQPLYEDLNTNHVRTFYTFGGKYDADSIFPKPDSHAN